MGPLIPWRRGEASARRTFRLIEPGQQLRLAAAILAVTLIFCGLAVGNSYAAYRTLVEVAFDHTPVRMGEDIAEQTRHYVRVTTTLVLGYALAVLALSVVFVRRLVGPLVALERHAHALRSGDYRSRVGLRAGSQVYAGLASQLNELAQRLEQGARREEDGGAALSI